MVELAQKWVDRWGFKCIKVKGGVLEPDLEVETMKLLRERFGPSMGLRIDPNAIWSVETSRRVAYKLKDIDLEYLEDPNRGRTAIHELLDLSERIREMILERRPGSEVKRAAKEEGMRFLRDSALEKVRMGVSTLKEVNKVTFIEG